MHKARVTCAVGRSQWRDHEALGPRRLLFLTGLGAQEMRMSGRELVASERMSVAEAFVTYNIPASTLYDHARCWEGLNRGGGRLE